MEINSKEKIIHWFMNEGRLIKNSGEFIHQFIMTLNQEGLSIIHSHLGFQTIHPQVERISFKWQKESASLSRAKTPHLIESQIIHFPGGVLNRSLYTFGLRDGALYRKSPFYKIIHLKQNNVVALITPGQKEFEYPILEDLQKIGATGYLALPMTYHDGIREPSSWSTDREGGFREEDIALLEAVLPCLSLGLEIHLQNHVTESLLGIYLGKRTGKKVLEGVIQRGDIEKIETIIWYSDLRNFTSMADKIDSHDLVKVLNDYFEMIHHIIFEHHGEILKFIGDAILATFPLEIKDKNIYLEVIDAVHNANRMLERFNETIQDSPIYPLEHGIALHIGDVQYGNIGAEQRLDFTIIGQAVNIASRIEGLCVKVGNPVLTSEIFAQQLPHAFELIGEFSLKGVNAPQQIFALKPSSDDYS